MSTLLKTAESVTPSHPDKVCDQISDAILDACLHEDRDARVAIEVLGGHGLITICGELTTTARIDTQEITRRVYKGLGYEKHVGIVANVVSQSHEIGRGVDNDGAGDQGIMVGYATKETEEMIPLEVLLSRKLTMSMGKHDGKAQITTENGKVVRIVTSVCQNGNTDDVRLNEAIQAYIAPCLHERICDVNDVWLQNPNGSWTVGGFDADTGLTGRKLAVDNYGPHIPLGGGCFSGKDATKVDRSGAYMARKIAVEYLRARGAYEVFVHLAYAIGVSEPVMATATIDGVSEKVHGYDLRPRAIIEMLDLRTPQFEQTARFGHFGNNFAWDN